MSPYQEACARLGAALTEHAGAGQNLTEAQERYQAASDELAAAAGEVRKFEVDPEYRGPQNLTGAAA